MISKNILLPVLAVVIIGGTMILNANQVHAQSNNNPLSKLVQMIAQKFGLDQNQVQSLVDQFQQEQKQNRVQKMKNKEKSRLDQLIQQEKITSIQEQAIIDELAALKSKYNTNNLKSMTLEERKAQFQAMQNELNSWTKSQGIDPTLIMPGFGKGGFKRGRGMFEHGKWPTPTPTPSAK